MKLLVSEVELREIKGCETLIPLQCEICHSTFYRKKFIVTCALKGNKNPCTCGKECFKKLVSKRQIPYKKSYITINCESCKKEFQRNKSSYKQKIKNSKKQFCSVKCVSQWKIKNKIGRKSIYPKYTILNCNFCFKDFERKNTYECRRNIRRGILPFCSFHCASKFKHRYHNTGNLRSTLELWIENKLKDLYPSLNIIYNDRITINMELDIYIPSLNLAFELNGIHHYKPIYGINSFTKSIFRDIIKEYNCKSNHINLYVIDCRNFSRLNEEIDIKYLNEIKLQIDKKLNSERMA